MGCWRFFYGTVNPTAGAFLIGANIVGFTFGQTKTGAVIQNVLCAAGCAVMATDGGVGEAITGTGCAIAVLQNSAASYKGSFLDLSKHRNSEATETERKTWVEKISEPIISLPTKGLQLITGHYQDNPNSHLAEFASSVDEISRRPLFQGNFFTTIVNLGLIGSAVGDLFEENYHDAFQKTAAVVLWSVGNFFSGASLQEDSQKHFFSTLGKRPAKKFET